MKTTRLQSFCGPIAVVLLLGGFLEAQPRGGFEVETRQGSLSRWESWWKPSVATEGWWWWEPDRGGSAWVRLGDLQIGPLVSVSGAEGRRAWGRAARTGSGRWGAVFEGEFGGVWAVQTPELFEGGLQAGGSWGPWSLAAGGDRSWSLGSAATPPWTDRGRVGGSWTWSGWAAGAEASGRLVGTAAQGGLRGRWSFDHGPWEAETSAQWDSQAPYRVRARAGWRENGSSLSATWDRKKGVQSRGTLALALGGVDGALSAEARWAPWSVRGGVSASGKATPGRWTGGWSLGPGPQGLAQVVTASWKEASFELEAKWKVNRMRLGWMGPGTSLGLTLRWLF